ncbi:uncharacterized protein VTP21DRAFT_7231 [Calcarisporiella thermophila]|uniref:uncharacterized protein n=1 Tax=Calcarisporiella thermophila TaxID=911321 RepID=UPI0037423208
MMRFYAPVQKLKCFVGSDRKIGLEAQHMLGGVGSLQEVRGRRADRSLWAVLQWLPALILEAICCGSFNSYLVQNCIFQPPRR